MLLLLALTVVFRAFGVELIGFLRVLRVKPNPVLGFGWAACAGVTPDSETGLEEITGDLNNEAKVERGAIGNSDAAPP